MAEVIKTQTKEILEESRREIEEEKKRIQDTENKDNIEDAEEVRNTKEATMVDTNGLTKVETKEMPEDMLMATMLMELKEMGLEEANEKKKENPREKRKNLKEMKLMQVEMERIRNLEIVVKNEPQLSNMWSELIILKGEMERETDKKKKKTKRKKVSERVNKIYRMSKEIKWKRRNETFKVRKEDVIGDAKKTTENELKIIEGLFRISSARDNDGELKEDTKEGTMVDTNELTKEEMSEEIPMATMLMELKEMGLEEATEKKKEEPRKKNKNHREMRAMQMEITRIINLGNEVKNEPQLSKIWSELIMLKDEMERKTDMVKKKTIRKKVSKKVEEIYRKLKEIKKKRNNETDWDRKEDAMGHAKEATEDELKIFEGLFRISSARDIDGIEDIEELKEDTKEGTMVDTSEPTKVKTKKGLSEKMEMMLIELDRKRKEMANEKRKEPKRKIKKELKELKLRWRELQMMESDLKNDPKKGLSQMWPELSKIKRAIEKETDVEAKKKLRKERSKMWQEINKMLAEEKITKKEVKSQRRVQSDISWQQLSLAQREFMNLNPRTRCAVIDNFIYEAVFSKSISSLQSEYDFSLITADSFREIFELLIMAEEAWEHTEMRKYDMKLVAVETMEHSRKKGKILYRCTVPGLSRGQPSLIPSDGLIMDDGSTQYSMRIVEIDHDLVTFEPVNSKDEIQLKNSKCNISFVPSGICYDRFLRALETIDYNERFKEILFGEGPTGQNGCSPSAKIDFYVSGTEELDKRFAILNDRQKQAIIHIVEAKCRPNLYILFGPPGTGKTFTVVETVVQIYKRDKRSRILVCSSSNTCVDSIASSIHDTRQINSMIRLSAKHHYDKLLCPPNYFTATP